MEFCKLNHKITPVPRLVSFVPHKSTVHIENGGDECGKLFLPPRTTNGGVKQDNRLDLMMAEASEVLWPVSASSKSTVDFDSI